jgi:uncharacterized protein
LALEKMTRLREHLLEPYGEIWVDLEFGGNGRKKFVEGRITGEMILQCQRCMQAMPQKVEHRFRLAIIESDAEVAALLPGEEPLIAEGEELLVADFIEDELELLLPMVIMHPEGQCESGYQSSKEDTSDEQAAENPFAVLANLKK